MILSFRRINLIRQSDSFWRCVKKSIWTERSWKFLIKQVKLLLRNQYIKQMDQSKSFLSQQTDIETQPVTLCILLMESMLMVS